eukprot:CAMPEP_0170777208 /NCGR_PEP_ID=MMETSP0733-20121128/11642_1 /TAXON_ID=186038 /ORGANISM="Fragilariopsis kerguelensis, Strain L26-C5" /LENGTH=121 /DNA_ID=CAMNT_0011120363 /DNA_START=56 /DNA_END=421 /DNA_ORIENTATION=+
MFTENTHLKNVTPVGNSNTSDDMDMGKGNTYQHPLLIVAGISLATIVFTAVACKTAGYSLVYTGGFAESAGGLTSNQVDTANLALTKDVFGLGDKSEVYCCDKVCCNDDYCCNTACFICSF